MANAKPVLICCRKLDAFQRAHAWALNRGLTSLLLSPADWPNSTSIAAEFGAAGIITDEPSQPHFCKCRVTDAASLPQERPGEPGAWPDPVAILFTSGSTGAPTAVSKDARAILGEFALLKAWFRDGPPMTDFISTVPLEHMFGYTFAFWLPHLMNGAILEKRPVIPTDLKNACAAVKKPAWVITTPTHLRAYAQLPSGFDNVAGLICSTSPLSTDLARAAASRFKAPITEIYGSTESGAVAARVRTADEQATPGWMPLPGIGIQPSSAGTAVCSIPHVAGAVELSDLIEMDGPRFSVLGRTGDLVKICGKRHSLAALNQMLAGAPGVRDSAYFISDAAAPAETQRAAALVVLSEGYSTEDVLGGLRGMIDDVFLPRPIYAVDDIPRTDAGKIRNSDLQRMFQSLSVTGVLHLTEEN